MDRFVIFEVSKIRKKGYIEMRKKIYLEPLKKCPGSLYFTLLIPSAGRKSCSLDLNKLCPFLPGL